MDELDRVPLYSMLLLSVVYRAAILNKVYLRSFRPAPVVNCQISRRQLRWYRSRCFRPLGNTLARICPRQAPSLTPALGDVSTGRLTSISAFSSGRRSVTCIWLHLKSPFGSRADATLSAAWRGTAQQRKKFRGWEWA